MSYLAKLKEKIGDANAARAPAKAAEGAFAASAASPVALVARNSPDIALPAELERLIICVASLHAFSPSEIREAREIAAGDVAKALICFRRLANQAGTPSPDDRVMCGDCGNLVRGRCQAAAQGLMEDTYSGYSPVPDILRRCGHFKLKGY